MNMTPSRSHPALLATHDVEATPMDDLRRRLDSVRLGSTVNGNRRNTVGFVLPSTPAPRPRFGQGSSFTVIQSSKARPFVPPTPRTPVVAKPTSQAPENSTPPRSILKSSSMRQISNGPVAAPPPPTAVPATPAFTGIRDMFKLPPATPWLGGLRTMFTIAPSHRFAEPSTASRRCTPTCSLAGTKRSKR